MHRDGDAVRRCRCLAGAAAGRRITTIEGLGEATAFKLHQAGIGQQVPQCGYCQSGMLMSAAALLKAHSRPTDAQIDAAMTN